MCVVARLRTLRDRLGFGLGRQLRRLCLVVRDGLFELGELLVERAIVRGDLLRLLGRSLVLGGLQCDRGGSGNVLLGQLLRR